jgi:hypothetical protein
MGECENTKSWTVGTTESLTDIFKSLEKKNWKSEISILARDKKIFQLVAKLKMHTRKKLGKNNFFYLVK